MVQLRFIFKALSFVGRVKRYNCVLEPSSSLFLLKTVIFLQKISLDVIVNYGSSRLGCRWAVKSSRNFTGLIVSTHPQDGFYATTRTWSKKNCLQNMGSHRYLEPTTGVQYFLQSRQKCALCEAGSSFFGLKTLGDLLVSVSSLYPKVKGRKTDLMPIFLHKKKETFSCSILTDISDLFDNQHVIVSMKPTYQTWMFFSMISKSLTQSEILVWVQFELVDSSFSELMGNWRGFLGSCAQLMLKIVQIPRILKAQKRKRRREDRLV